MTFFILVWYEASAPWWVAFTVILGSKIGYWLVNNYGNEIASFFEFED